MENEEVNDNTMNDQSLSFEEVDKDDKGVNNTLNNYTNTNTKKNEEYSNSNSNKRKDENSFGIQPRINRNNNHYSNINSNWKSKNNTAYNKSQLNQPNIDNYDDDEEDDPIANAFYDLPINNTRVNYKNETDSINNTMKDNSQFINSKQDVKQANDLLNNSNNHLNSIHYLFPNQTITSQENSFIVPLCPQTNKQVNVNANIDCDIANLFTINKQLNYSTNNPLWYISNEYKPLSFYGPISSIGLCTLFREKKINGATQIKPLDIFKPINSQETCTSLSNMTQPNYLIDNYIINQELEANLNQFDLSLFNNSQSSIKPNNAQLKNIKPKKNSKQKRPKGNELVIKHQYE